MSQRLELAGIRRTVPEFTLLVGAAMLAGAALGAALSGVILAVMMGALVLMGSIVYVSVQISRRRSAFADQLDDLVQLLGSNLRAGHSVLQAMDSLARELDDPAASEIARVVNQVRVGRDFGGVLEDAAERMESDDFRWIAQAIAIQRQVGGNLAEVMDTVGETIRERNAIRRQVRSLSAEGKLSAYILVGLPIAVALILQIINPGYMTILTESLFGWFMIVTAVTMLALGSFWMSRIIKIKF
ncbi:type II secretion system F family protein [Ornithinimicrobium humiphilum]|uniref:Tight adherence protein B n=1 Tax=Ornithinimicrobium humiphilum TaxID=125288 RepID=A0A543KMW7_9MICO|nr:type II secretion system F family protein [Ornithinimicrobium humiphilum]TQM96427.1 tight adherence protein B [Ornithinimicrobium humiphilum]